MKARLSGSVAGWFWSWCVILAAWPDPGCAAEAAALEREYAAEVRPLLERYCFGCHSTEKHKGDLDLERLGTVAEARREPRVWEKSLEMLETGEMPPKEKVQPSDDEGRRLRQWIHALLDLEGRARAGDPGRVLLRRLSNVEYRLTLRDLIGVDLDPAKEFPIDGAAGEGFVNTGEALVMSPSLLEKYLAAAKAVAGHAVLLPDGLRFSAGVRPGDWVDELMKEIRGFYARYADSEGGTRINLQGIVFDTNTGGRLPIERYLAATLEERSRLARGPNAIAAVAGERGLNARYLGSLWSLMSLPVDGPISTSSSIVLDQLRGRWRTAAPADSTNLAAEIGQWQATLTRFQTVGHMKPWMVPVDPTTDRQEFRVPMPAVTHANARTDGDTVTLYLAVDDAGDGANGDFVVWHQPRLVAPGRPDIPLREVRGLARELSDRRTVMLASIARCLEAAAELDGAPIPPDLAAVAARHGIAADLLRDWSEYLGLGTTDTGALDHFTNRLVKIAGHDFVQGWGSPDTPNMAANASEQAVRIPGRLEGHGVAVHPSPNRSAVVGWRSPVGGSLRIEGTVTHAHPECGNGVTWTLELRRAATRKRLAGGISQGGKPVAVGPLENVRVRPGDLVAMVVGPRDGNHACDLTGIELVLDPAEDDTREWRLTREVSSDILAGNPHADRFGNADVWHFFDEPVTGGNDGSPVIPAGSLLDRWQSTDSADERRRLAHELQSWFTTGAELSAPDRLLRAQLTSLGGPLLGGARRGIASSSPRSEPPGAVAAEPWGLDPALFGRHPDGAAIDPTSLCVRAPAVVGIRLPAELVQGRELVVAATLHAPSGAEGTAQVRVLTERPTARTGLQPGTPVLVAADSGARARLRAAFDEFRRWFPAALCYPKIVPVDEVITLTVFHREDEPLCRLMLNEEEKARLDRLWSELRYVGRDALTMVDAYAQLMEYATQDSDPKLFAHLRRPIEERAEAFRRVLAESEPRHLDAVVNLAERAYRRPLTEGEGADLRRLYRTLRDQEMTHDEAIRLVLARVLVAPSFLYRVEQPSPGTEARPVNDWELASRLSYFLWSSMPDDGLRARASAGRLREPDVVVAEARRLIQDPRVRALAVEFACQWLHIRDFDTLDEKSERHFPTFAALRSDMYEESIRFFVDLFQRDGSVLEILDADHTFLNGPLAEHYGIPGVAGPEWRRVDGVRRQGRGGVLGMATVLAKQSGASRTSPILRGNWLVETLLGEKLPKPPPGVPQLPETETDTGELTMRQITERHSSVPECAVCHVRIDPFGFALEGYDAIGRRREQDQAGRRINTRTHLAWRDDVYFDGLDGLRQYLLQRRRDEFVRTFCRKLLGYALGRGLQLSDAPLVEAMQAELKRRDYRVSAALETIVRSQPFRYQRGLEATREERL